MDYLISLFYIISITYHPIIIALIKEAMMYVQQLSLPKTRFGNNNFCHIIITSFLSDLLLAWSDINKKKEKYVIRNRYQVLVISQTQM